MRGEIYTMSTKELSRIEVAEKILSKRLTQKAGGKQLGLSKRQVVRLVKRYQLYGAVGLLSKRRGQPSNHRYGVLFKQKIIGLVSDNYADFGPTLASEKLLERHELTISKETLRHWMMAVGLWEGKRRKTVMIHPQRTRRSCLGELVQIDGSLHAWFEERAPQCCLLVYIDDATSQRLQLYFCAAETTNAYFEASKIYLKQQGRAIAFYSDKHGIFRVNRPEAKNSTGETQFGRAMRELGIELICANSPQAKGRVERANSTLQDRLVKELRLNNISDIESANAFAAVFIEKHNRRFAKQPASPIDMHRKSLPNDDTLNLIFSHQCQRKLSKNLELSYNNIIYQIKSEGKGYRLRQSSITVCEDNQQQVTLRYKNSSLDYVTFDKKNRPTQIINAKGIERSLEKIKASAKQSYKPSQYHPWRQYEKTKPQCRKVA